VLQYSANRGSEFVFFEISVYSSQSNLLASLRGQHLMEIMTVSASYRVTTRFSFRQNQFRRGKLFFHIRSHYPIFDLIILCFHRVQICLHMRIKYLLLWSHVQQVSAAVQCKCVTDIPPKRLLYYIVVSPIIIVTSYFRVPGQWNCETCLFSEDHLSR